LEGRLNGEKVEMLKISEVPTFSADDISMASIMLFIPYKGTKLHLASNIIYVPKVPVVIMVMMVTFW
jgi:hypothetical protein